MTKPLAMPRRTYRQVLLMYSILLSLSVIAGPLTYALLERLGWAVMAQVLLISLGPFVGEAVSRKHLVEPVSESSKLTKTTSAD